MTNEQAKEIQLLRAALRVAIRQNSCDVLMTGEELRYAEKAMELTESALAAPIAAGVVPEGPAVASGKAAAWRIRIGESDMWGYCETESDADFLGKQSGLKYEKQPLFRTPAHPVAGILSSHAYDCDCGLIFRENGTCTKCGFSLAAPASPAVATAYGGTGPMISFGQEGIVVEMKTDAPIIPEAGAEELPGLTDEQIEEIATDYYEGASDAVYNVIGFGQAVIAALKGGQPK